MIRDEGGDKARGIKQQDQRHAHMQQDERQWKDMYVVPPGRQPDSKLACMPPTGFCRCSMYKI